MKLLAYLKINIKGLIKEFPAFLLSYGIYPIIIALVMGYMQKIYLLLQLITLFFQL